jgi:hypothetical protein
VTYLWPGAMLIFFFKLKAMASRSISIHIGLLILPKRKVSIVSIKNSRLIMFVIVVYIDVIMF